MPRTTTRHQQAIYLDHDKAKLLDELSEEMRVAKAILLREAVDDLLGKYGKLKEPRRQKAVPNVFHSSKIKRGQ